MFRIYKRSFVQLIILGIDPGIAILGYGVISYQGSRLIAQDYGAVCTRAHEPFPSRLSQLYDGMQALIDRFKPDAIAFEELFFCKNVGATGDASWNARAALRFWRRSSSARRFTSTRPCRSSSP
jgi:Holliday junction resolvasome RuvABC endonuclease subunit